MIRSMKKRWRKIPFRLLSSIRRNLMIKLTTLKNLRIWNHLLCNPNWPVIARSTAPFTLSSLIRINHSHQTLPTLFKTYSLRKTNLIECWTQRIQTTAKITKKKMSIMKPQKRGKINNNLNRSVQLRRVLPTRMTNSKKTKDIQINLNRKWCIRRMISKKFHSMMK